MSVSPNNDFPIMSELDTLYNASILSAVMFVVDIFVVLIKVDSTRLQLMVP